MNYLAHLLLSGNDIEVTVGNFIGDGVKGRIPTDLPPAMQNGVKLHRFIDGYADDHTVNLEMKTLLRPYFRKYAGVVLDMYHDHFLAMKWETYGVGDLEGFLDNQFSAFEPHLDYFPPKVLRLYQGMREGGWLLKYRSFDGLGRAFAGISKRTRYESNMENAIEVLEEHYDTLSDSFDLFFPDMVRDASSFRGDLLTTV
jgi:acyl carrier protein phosphodiesterase